MSVTIYHNPKCSKSRQTLKLLRTRGIKPVIIEYLKEPPDKITLQMILRLLKLKPQDIMRKNEDIYKKLRLGREDLGDEALISAMIKHPVLIERPIVLANGKAALGRPPENVLEII